MPENTNVLIYESKNFTVEIHPMPFVSRTDGGHIRIFPKDKKRVTDRTVLTQQQAIKNVMEKLIETDKYLPEKWGI